MYICMGSLLKMSTLCLVFQRVLIVNKVNFLKSPYTYEYKFMYICIYVNTNIYIYMYVYIIFVYTYIFTYIYIYICICIHICKKGDFLKVSYRY